MDRGAWWATVHGVAKESDTTEQLNNNRFNRIRNMSLKSGQSKWRRWVLKTEGAGKEREGGTLMDGDFFKKKNKFKIPSEGLN